MPNGSMAIPQHGQSLPGAIPQVIRVGLSQLVLALVNMQEEDGQVEQDDDDEGQDEDDGQRCEHPHQVLQEAEVVLKIPPSNPVLPGHEETREDTSRFIPRPARLIQSRHATAAAAAASARPSASRRAARAQTHTPEGHESIQYIQ